MRSLIFCHHHFKRSASPLIVYDSHANSSLTSLTSPHFPLPYDKSLSQVCTVLKKVYRFILSGTLMTGDVESS